MHIVYIYYMRVVDRFSPSKTLSKLKMWPIRKVVRFSMSLLALTANMVYFGFELMSSSQHLSGESPASTTEAAISILGAALALMAAGMLGRELRVWMVSEQKKNVNNQQHNTAKLSRTVSLNFLP